MFTVVRISPEGYKGYKDFNTREEAEAWLNSPSVKEDEDYGFWFQLKEN